MKIGRDGKCRAAVAITAICLYLIKPHEGALYKGISSSP